MESTAQETIFVCPLNTETDNLYMKFIIPPAFKKVDFLDTAVSFIPQNQNELNWNERIIVEAGNLLEKITAEEIAKDVFESSNESIGEDLIESNIKSFDNSEAGKDISAAFCFHFYVDHDVIEPACVLEVTFFHIGPHHYINLNYIIKYEYNEELSETDFESMVEDGLDKIDEFYSDSVIYIDGDSLD